MQPGVVVRIRVNPTTCMSVLDTLEAVGIDVKNKSFATCVSAALNVLVETAKASGVLSDPDPFQFNERMRYHKGQEAPDRRKLPKAHAGKMNPLIFADKTPDLGTPKWMRPDKVVKEDAAPTADWVDPSIPTDPYKLMQYREANMRLVDAQRKKQEAAVTDIVWSAKDEEQYQKDIALVYDGKGYEDAH